MNMVEKWNRYLKIPVKCNIPCLHIGTLNGLKSLILVLAYGCEYNNITEPLRIPYYDFKQLFNSYKSKQTSYIKKTINHMLDENNCWLLKYADINVRDKYVEVMYKKAIVDTSSKYKISLEDVAKFDRTFGLRMYLVYRQNRYKISKHGKRGFRYTNRDFMFFCGCINKKSVYTMLKRCNNTFQNITGVGINITKDMKDEYWTIRYV